MKNKRLWIICAVLFVALLGSVAVYTLQPEAEIENAGTSQNAAVEKSTLSYGETEHPIKEHLQTVLLIGTDSLEQYRKPENSLQDFYNFSQADFLVLLVLDKEANTADLIQLNRDTMTDVPWLDVIGQYGGTEFKQLCLAYNYGDGGMKSCKNTVRAVSALLMDAPIQSYIQIPMSAIGVINDLVGGVPITFDRDMTDIDPAFREGATILLDREMAESFIRSRMELENDTNTFRMERQRMYLDSFQTCARETFDSDSEFAMKVVETLSEYLQSNLTAQNLVDLMAFLDGAEVSPIRTPEGELVLGEEYYEFYVDETSLWELVKTAYCE